MKKLLLWVAPLCIIAGTQYGLMLMPEATLTIRAVSPQEIHDWGWGDRGIHQSSGLSVVGNESLVFLTGADAGGEDVTVYAWTLTGPAGSLAVMDSTGTMWNTFRPDVIGSYEVGLEITTASGTATATTTITAAEYVGLHVYASGLGIAGQCGGCHPGNTADWWATDHSSMFTLAIDGLKSSHYNEGCIECHTVGFDPTADNGGFDDRALDAGWTFPAHPAPGVWTDMVTNYGVLADFTNIQCESCHGPGSLHNGDRSKIDISIDSGMCAQCHEEDPYHRRPSMWKNSGHATGTSFAYAGGRNGCADCHSGYGFIAKVDPQSDLSEKVGGGEYGISCATCHDPHSPKNEDQLRKVDNIILNNGVTVTWGGLGRLCMNCHISRRDATEYSREFHNHYGPHHSNQTDMLAGTNANNFGRYIPSSTHRDAVDNACVGCHMSATPGTAEDGRDHLGDHSWAMTAVLEDGSEVDHVGACVDCHGTLDSFDDLIAREDYDGDGAPEAVGDEIEGLLHELAMLLPPLGEATVEVTPEYSPTELLTAYNYFFVEDDGSHGLHNFQYTVGLLQVSIDVMNYGVLAPGEMMAVMDVPNDQGRQVHVEWTRFGGDGPSDDPIAMYYVWRKDMMPTASKTDLLTLDKVTSKPTNGEPLRIALEGEVWTAVASQPAARMDRYSAIAPTLGDSTAMGGFDSMFRISAHTKNLGDVMLSDPMSGFSMDNLAPAAPTGLAALVTATKVTLNWDDPVDADFNRFGVYRSTVAGFEPVESDRISETDEPTFGDISVVIEETYYYRVAAYDFNGNRGEFSAEVVAAVSVGVDDLGEVPIEFALRQNYPNPFNPTTTIAFDVPVQSMVRISVFDILGRPVSELVNEEMSAGRHSVTMQAGNLSSGIYLVRMRAGSRVFERSMLLVK